MSRKEFVVMVLSTVQMVETNSPLCAVVFRVSHNIHYSLHIHNQYIDQLISDWLSVCLDWLIVIASQNMLFNLFYICFFVFLAKRYVLTHPGGVGITVFGLLCPMYTR